MLNEDPNSTFNLLMAQLCFCLWEFVDSLNLLAVPKDPCRPILSGNWVLTDYIPQKVSPSGTGLSVFPYCSSDYTSLDYQLYPATLRTILKCIS